MLKNYKRGGRDDKGVRVRLIRCGPRTMGAFRGVRRRFGTARSSVRLAVRSPGSTVAMLGAHFVERSTPSVVKVNKSIGFSGFVSSSVLVSVSSCRNLSSVGRTCLSVSGTLRFMPRSNICTIPCITGTTKILCGETVFRRCN